MSRNKEVHQDKDQAGVEVEQTNDSGELFASPAESQSEGNGEDVVDAEADARVNDEPTQENLADVAPDGNDASDIGMVDGDDAAASSATVAAKDGEPPRSHDGAFTADTDLVADIATGDVGEQDDEEDPDAGRPFIAARAVAGEFLVSQSELLEWEHHPRRGSRLIGDHYAALTLAAADPRALRPIVVIEKPDGRYAVVDGRFLLHAIRSAHPGNGNVQVRCVPFEGTEAEAVASVCDEGLGAVNLTEMEKARILLSLKQTSGVSQTAMAERYPRLTVTKVNNMLRAARVWASHPQLFRVLQEPDRAGIDYGVKLFTAIRRMSADELRALLDRAEDLEANGERFTPADALDVLRMPVAFQVTEAEQSQVEKDGNDEGEQQEAEAATSASATSPLDAVEDEEPLAEDVFGHDDQPVGTAEPLEDGSERLTLPMASLVAGMSMAEREEAASAFIQRVRRHFGLEQQD